MINEMPITPPESQVMAMNLIIIRWSYGSKRNDSIPLGGFNKLSNALSKGSQSLWSVPRVIAISQEKNCGNGDLLFMGVIQARKSLGLDHKNIGLLKGEPGLVFKAYASMMLQVHYLKTRKFVTFSNSISEGDKIISITYG